MARFHFAGGAITDLAAGRSQLTLAEAHTLAGIWARKALVFEAVGSLALARLCAVDAAELCHAIRQASDWRRASGHRDVHAPDRVRA